MHISFKKNLDVKMKVWIYLGILAAFLAATSIALASSSDRIYFVHFFKPSLSLSSATCANIRWGILAELSNASTYF